MVPVFALFLLAGPAAALPSAQTTSADYTQMLEARYGSDPIPLPPGGLTLTRDTATWTFSHGSVRLAEPTADGRITGLVFEGEGRFRMTIPDPVELRQLQRMAENRRLELIDEPFTALVLRTSEDLIRTLLPDASHTSYQPSELAKKRRSNWLTQRFEDVDARIACGLMIPGDELLRLDMDTASYGWLSYRFDGLASEEIEIAYWHPEYKGLESWVRLDRAEDRLPTGRPRSERRPLIDVEHVDIEADVTRANKKYSRLGRAAFNPRQGHYQVDLTFTALVDGPQALPLVLDTLAEVASVSTEDGTALPFLRDHIGARSSGVDNMFYDNDLLVLLDRPLRRGERRRLRFVYQQMTLNYLAGRSWYPGTANGFFDPHTGTLRITSDDRYDIFSMGEQIASTADKGTKTTVWKVEKPVRMLTFAFADQNSQIERMEHEGLPEVVAFGPSHENQIWNVAADMVNSMAYFTSVFGHAPTVPIMYVTGILDNHGQSFEGFIHMAESTMHFESKGRTEAFRAHEVAHQWWGHVVAWKSYRDQWLSEAFAEFSAMLFMQATMEDGQQMYDEMVTAYSGGLTGLSKPTHFGTGVVERNAKERDRIGPIGVGWRASTASSGNGYSAMTYQKGALVLHMLRTLLRNVTKSDKVFFDVLKRLLDEHQGGAVSTQDFIDTLTAVAPGNWQWFFDEWINDTDIPTYFWHAETASDHGKTVLRLNVRQENVTPGFRMPVPVKLEFGKKKSGQVVVLIDEPQEHFSIPIPAAPKKVVFNPDHAVLAVVKKE